MILRFTEMGIVARVLLADVVKGVKLLAGVDGDVGSHILVKENMVTLEGQNQFLFLVIPFKRLEQLVDNS